VTEKCPPSQSLTWDFGKVEDGRVIDITSSVPYELRSRIQALGVVRAEAGPSDLPAGARFTLDLTDWAGTLQGRLPDSAATYSASFSLYDGRGCEVARLVGRRHLYGERDPRSPSPTAIPCGSGPTPGTAPPLPPAREDPSRWRSRPRIRGGGPLPPAPKYGSPLVST
jgi:hypothetical protein